MQRRKIKLINVQASVSIIDVTIFSQGKEITRIEEILVNLFLWKQYYVIKVQVSFRFLYETCIQGKKIVRFQYFWPTFSGQSNLQDKEA